MKLDNLPIRALHRLDAANSRLRHSIVEACFYNLRVLAQELPGRRGNGDFKANLNEALGKVGSARKLIDEYFTYEVTHGITVTQLFPEEYGVVGRTLRQVEALAHGGTPSRDNQDACREFTQQVVSSVDKILGGIDRIRQTVADRKLALRPLLDELVALNKAPCESQGIAIDLKDTSDANLSAFVDKSSLLNALSELVRNAIRHAFLSAHTGEKRVTIGLDADRDTRDIMISIRDNGCGMSADQLQKVGTAGASTSGGGDGVALVRRIIERDHLGLVTFKSEPDHGTCVSIRLPRRAEPALEPQPVPVQVQLIPLEPQAAPEGIPDPMRIAVAILVFLTMLAIGLVLAWYVATRQ